MQNKIALGINGTVWIATYEGPHAETIVGLFGGESIPTAYRIETPAHVVREQVQRRNPGVAVYIIH